MRAFFGTSREGGLLASLSRDGKILASAEGAFAGDMLALLDLALKKAKAKKEAIDEIVVDRGPGGFSVVRRRVSVATALARALGAKLCAVGELSSEEAAALPANAFIEKAPIHPLYAAEPNITLSKKKKTWSAR